MLRTLLAAATALLLLLPAAAPAALPGDLPIGLAASTTGSAAVYGPQQEAGAQLAVDEVNTSRMLGDARLRLVVQDDLSTPEGATAAFQNLMAANVVALIGPTLSGVALAADPAVNAAGRVVLGVSNTADGITKVGPFVFKASLSESDVTPFTVRAARQALHVRRPAMIVRTDQPFTVDGAAGFRAALRKAGAPIVATAGYRGTPASFRALLRRLARRRPDALVIESLTEGPQLMREARQLAAFRRIPFLGGNAFNSPAVVRAAGRAAEGLIVGTPWHPDVDNPASHHFVLAFQRRFKQAPDAFAAQAYTGVILLAQALKQAQTTDQTALRDVLAGIRGLSTPLGRFSFDAHRDPVYRPVVQVVRKGRFQLLRP
jgi:branched-chain amino acid transport system substrate-binding protein